MTNMNKKTKKKNRGGKNTLKTTLKNFALAFLFAEVHEHVEQKHL